MIEDCFKLMQYVEDTTMSLRCLGYYYIVVVLFHMSFTFGQTFFIFKSHKVDIYKFVTYLQYPKVCLQTPGRRLNRLNVRFSYSLLQKRHERDKVRQK